MNISLRVAVIYNLLAKQPAAPSTPDGQRFRYGWDRRAIWSHVAMRARVEERLCEVFRLPNLHASAYRLGDRNQRI